MPLNPIQRLLFFTFIILIDRRRYFHSSANKRGKDNNCVVDVQLKIAVRKEMSLQWDINMPNPTLLEEYQFFPFSASRALMRNIQFSSKAFTK